MAETDFVQQVQRCAGKVAWRQVDKLATLAKPCANGHLAAVLFLTLLLYLPTRLSRPTPCTVPKPTRSAYSHGCLLTCICFHFHSKGLLHVQDCCAGKHARQPRSLATAGASAVPLHLLLWMRPRTAKGSLGTTVEGVSFGANKEGFGEELAVRDVSSGSDCMRRPRRWPPRQDALRCSSRWSATRSSPSRSVVLDTARSAPCCSSRHAGVPAWGAEAAGGCACRTRRGAAAA